MPVKLDDKEYVVVMIVIIIIVVCISYTNTFPLLLCINCRYIMYRDDELLGVMKD